MVDSPLIRYAYSTDGERYTGPFDSLAETITEAKASGRNHVWIGEVVNIKPSEVISVYLLVDHMAEALDDRVGEAAQVWTGELSSAKLDRLKDCIANWFERNAPINCFGVANVKEMDISDLVSPKATK